LITHIDKGIGRVVAFLFAKEGAGVAIVYLGEYKDAKIIAESVEKYDSQCLTARIYISEQKSCANFLKTAV
jgi:NAD(P)-dependent dehydrogenase (short-subunit alcohol dehydrogenase family)